ncbi:MAG: tyrosine-type recombinase/integrase [Desulfobacula sp.]|nr:tyrosine-type recombinase/integrase [Desulfobacula sp.]
MDKNNLMFKFKEHLKVLNRSSSTIKNYTSHLEHFFAAVKEQNMQKVTRDMIEDYVSGLYQHRTVRGKPYSTGTLCIKIRSIKRFFEFLEKSNLVFIDPSEHIKEPKLNRRVLKPVMTTKEINRLMDQPNLGTFMGIRDRSVMELFYSTGIRKEELCNLTIYDADLTGRMVRINKGKGQKDRVVPMGRHAAKFIREYIAAVRPHFTKKNRACRCLFVDRMGKPLSKQAVRVMVKKYAKAAKIKKQVSPHMFRHCFATALVKNGADIFAVQKMLGHACVSTTQVYIRSLGLDIKKIHQKTHPREKDTIDKKLVKPAIERMIEDG